MEKQEYIKEILNREEYLELFKCELQKDKLDRIIDMLIAQYIGSLSKVRFSNLNCRDDINHAEQSELFSKIMLLAHEFGGYSKVIKVVNLIRELTIEMMANTIEELENERKQ